MIWLRGHPGFRTLNRYMDGALAGRPHARVADHLARCARCREEVALLRRIGDAVRELPTPRVGAETFRRAMERRRSGERVLLSQRDPGPQTARPAARRAPAAIAAGLVLLLVGVVLSTRVLEADRATFQVLPERPAAGELLRVEYRGGTLFEDETHLKLRARYRTADNRSWHLLAGILARDEDGIFRTQVQLPDSVVYAAFAVEDLRGRRVDSNNQRLWEVLSHGDDRVPTLDAMTARVRDLELRDWGAAYDLAREMTRLYPDAPRSWAIRFSFEASLFDRDSVIAEHRRHFERLERRLSDDGGATADEAAWLAIYAVTLGDVSSAAVWVQHADAAPDDPSALYEAKALLATVQFGDQPRGFLASLDEIWRAAPTPLLSVSALALTLSRRLQDPELLKTWIPRSLEARPSQERVLEDLTGLGRSDQLSELLGQVSREVRQRLQAPPEGSRPLYLNVESYEPVRARRAQLLLVQLAQTALGAGHESDAAAVARDAVTLAWGANPLLDAGDVLFAAGDTSSALDAWARAGADPQTSRPARTRAAGLLDATGLGRWEEEVASRRVELLRHVAESAVVRYLDLPQGLPADVRLVGFVDAYSLPDLEQLKALAGIVDTLAGQGVEALIVDIRGDDRLTELAAAQGIALPVTGDPDGALRTAFRSSRTPDYFVLDGFGRVRFEHSELSEVLRQFEALRHMAGPMLSADF